MGVAPSSKIEKPPNFGSDFDALFTVTCDVDRMPVEIGRGAFSRVFLCEQTGRFRQKCAAKYFDLDKLRQRVEEGLLDSEKLEIALVNTRRGLQVLMNFSGHDSIIQLLNIFEAPDHHLMSVMEYADGGELFELITTRIQLTEVEAQAILKQISSGVVFLHSNGSVHRDIKAENVCLVTNGSTQQWKLCDFGFARDFENDDDTMSTLCGTRGYAAPEVFFGKPYRARPIDVYSLGVLSHMIMGGYLPFKDGGVEVIFHPERWRKVSNTAKDFVSECVRYDSSKRLKSEELLKHNFLSGLVASDEVKAKK